MERSFASSWLIRPTGLIDFFASAGPSLASKGMVLHQSTLSVARDFDVP